MLKENYLDLGREISCIISVRRNSNYYRIWIHLNGHLYYRERLIRCGRRKEGNKFLYMFEDQHQMAEENNTLYRKLDDERSLIKNWKIRWYVLDEFSSYQILICLRKRCLSSIRNENESKNYSMHINQPYLPIDCTSSVFADSILTPLFKETPIRFWPPKKESLPSPSILRGGR